MANPIGSDPDGTIRIVLRPDVAPNAWEQVVANDPRYEGCLLYTSDAADE